MEKHRTEGKLSLFRSTVSIRKPQNRFYSENKNGEKLRKEFFFRFNFVHHMFPINIVRTDN